MEKKKKSISLSLPDEVHAVLKIESEKTGIPISSLIKLSLQKYQNQK